LIHFDVIFHLVSPNWIKI